jgi:hypothetical protein
MVNLNKWIKSVRKDTRKLKESRSMYDDQKVKAILFGNLLVFGNLSFEDAELKEEYEGYLSKAYNLVYGSSKRDRFVEVADLAFEISDRIKKYLSYQNKVNKLFRSQNGRN